MTRPRRLVDTATAYSNTANAFGEVRNENGWERGGPNSALDPLTPLRQAAPYDAPRCSPHMARLGLRATRAGPRGSTRRGCILIATGVQPTARSRPRASPWFGRLRKSLANMVLLRRSRTWGVASFLPWRVASLAFWPGRRRGGEARPREARVAVDFREVQHADATARQGGRSAERRPR